MSNSKQLAQQFMDCRRLLLKTVTGLVPVRDAEDIVQESYVRACQSRTSITNVKAFMVKTVRNLALDYLKSAHVRLMQSAEDTESDFIEQASEKDITLQEVVSGQEYKAFCQAVENLPEQCQKAFVMRKVYGYSQKEISMELGISQSTVEKHIAAGLHKTMLLLKDANQDFCGSSARYSKKIGSR